MKYAIVKIGSSQYKVSEGEEIAVEKLPLKKDEAVVFDQVLLLVDGQELKIGQPLVAGTVVKGKVLEQTKDKKIRVATFKAKSRYRRVIGHRKHLTRILIQSVGPSGAAKKTPAKKVKKEAAKTVGKVRAKATKATKAVKVTKVTKAAKVTKITKVTKATKVAKTAKAAETSPKKK